MFPTKQRWKLSIDIQQVLALSTLQTRFHTVKHPRTPGECKTWGAQSASAMGVARGKSCESGVLQAAR